MAANVETLKRPSGANSLLQPEREPLIFFADAMLGRHVIPGALRAAGERVEIHHDHFPEGTADPVWLSEVGKRGWIVLTRDQRIRYRAVETASLWRARVRAFVLTAKGDLNGQEFGQIFVKALPSMKRLCRKAPAPFIAHVSKSGEVKLVRS